MTLLDRERAAARPASAGAQPPELLPVWMPGLVADSLPGVLAVWPQEPVPPGKPKLALGLSLVLPSGSALALPQALG